MKYGKLTLLSVTLLLAVSSASCSTVADGCSELARHVLTTPTAHAVLGSSDDTEQDWREYGLFETGQLNKANDDKKTGFEIISACEARDAKISRRIRLF